MRRIGWAAVAAVGVWCSVTGAAAQPPLRVEIESPHGGVVDGPTVGLTARISDATVRTATMVVNGAAYEVPVEGGRIEQMVVAGPGNNRVGIVVQRGRETARDSVTFRYRGEPVEMMVLLTWPARGEIIDLWVREPEGETCKWDHRETASGGRLLDFSADAIGFGSQAYVLRSVRAGRFRVKVHYWGAYSYEDERSWHVYEETLALLERASGPERDRLARRLDAWARPAPVQTPVHAEVVLFPGTRAERRWRFDVLAQRTGQLVTLGEVEISDAMIRDARMEAP